MKSEVHDGPCRHSSFRGAWRTSNYAAEGSTNCIRRNGSECKLIAHDAPRTHYSIGGRNCVIADPASGHSGSWLGENSSIAGSSHDGQYFHAHGVARRQLNLHYAAGLAPEQCTANR